MDFGEVWSEDDAGLWPPEREVPIGQPLTYGCEVGRLGADRAKITVFALQKPREVMKEGASFTLRDGHVARATGRIVGPSSPDNSE